MRRDFTANLDLCQPDIFRLSGPGGIRTRDLISAIDARSQLRYRPLFVEMAGIEPASERFVPRTSTSVVTCYLSSDGLQATKGYAQPSAGARKPLFRAPSGIHARHSGFFVAQTHPRPECGDGWTRSTFGTLCALHHCIRQRGGEQHRS